MAAEQKEVSVNDVLFAALVRDFESMALAGFGKIVNPVSQQVERSLERAKFAIDMLGMLEEKTRGNLDETEVSLLRQVLTNLRLNYVDELEKEKKAAQEKETAGGSQPKGEAAGAGGPPVGEAAGAAGAGEESGRSSAEVGGRGQDASGGDRGGAPQRGATGAGAGGDATSGAPKRGGRGRKRKSEGKRDGGKK